MNYYLASPPAWLVVVCGVVFALPMSALVGLGAAKVFDWFTSRHP